MDTALISLSSLVQGVYTLVVTTNNCNAIMVSVAVCQGRNCNAVLVVALPNKLKRSVCLQNVETAHFMQENDSNNQLKGYFTPDIDTLHKSRVIS